jgi:hypothetical protein
MSRDLINLESYTPLEMAVWGCGAVMFVAVYVLVFIQMFRSKVVGIPAFAFGANIAWEFLWGYVYQSDMGALFTWGLKVYMPMSLVIGAFLLRYGYKQFLSPRLQRNLAAVVLGGGVFWLGVFVLLKPVDDAAGMSSVMLVNLVLSVSFLPLLRSRFRQEGGRGLDTHSYAIGWLRLLGGAFNSAFCLLHLPERGWVHAVCLAICVLDVTYLVLFHRLRPSTGPKAARRVASPGDNLLPPRLA